MNVKWFLANLGLSSAQKEVLGKAKELDIYGYEECNQDQDGYNMSVAMGLVEAGHISPYQQRLKKSEKEREAFINQCQSTHIASWRVSLALRTQ
jgi:uncharacterized protein (DUF1015 family)